MGERFGGLEITINHPSEYEKKLYEQGGVIASLKKREAAIKLNLDRAMKGLPSFQEGNLTWEEFLELIKDYIEG